MTSMMKTRVANARRVCTDETQAREHCYDTLSHVQEATGTRDPEGCVLLDLNEKRCLSFQLCPDEAKEYYIKPAIASTRGDAASCSAVLERFARDRDMSPRPMVARTAEAMSRTDKKKCGKIAYRLAKCLSAHELGKKEKLQ